MASQSPKDKETKEKRKLARAEQSPQAISQQHSFLTDPSEVKKMEKDLLDLMGNFNEGKLHAFGNSCTLEEMDRVRESQECLAQLHFELDVQESHRKEHEEVGRNKNLERLMKDLEKLSSSMLEVCNYSGYKIYPGHGKRFIRLDGKCFNFLDKKCERSFLMKRNPRKISWTVLYRRKNKKGSIEEVTKKRTRRTVKFQRAIQGATLENIIAKRNQKPEVRKAQREQAIRSAKDKVRQKKDVKKTTKVQGQQPLKSKQTKPKGGKTVGRVGGKR